ncbi:actin cortical patch SUR7/pH-response regulator pali [Kalaharituber pfeilii]|nr:actin cortical patch SUR7/pH-response regulator pali [Kalaharituber pfeilii]
MVRISVVIPILLSAAAFICALLALLSGKDTNTLTNVYILRVRLPNNFVDEIPDELLDNIPDSLLDSLAQTAAKELGLRDFYTSHVMNYCSGFTVLTGDPDGDGPQPATGNRSETTFCSPIEGLYAFNPVDIFRTELIPGVTVSDLGIPEDVETGARALAAAYKAMFITFLIGIILAGLSVIFGLLIGWNDSRGIAAGMGFLALIATLALAIASAIGTALAVKLRDILNDHMEAINVRAEHDGGKFMGLSWASVAAMLLALIYWCFGCCFGGSAKRRRQERRATRKAEMTQA